MLETSLAGQVIIGRESITRTNERIRPHVRRTPVIEIDGADFGLDGVRVVFKLELLQHAGSFKARGAFANLLLREVPTALWRLRAAIMARPWLLRQRNSESRPGSLFPRLRRWKNRSGFADMARTWWSLATVTWKRWRRAKSGPRSRGRCAFMRTISPRRCSARERSAWSSRNRRRNSILCWWRSAEAVSSAASPPGTAAGSHLSASS